MLRGRLSRFAQALWWYCWLLMCVNVAITSSSCPLCSQVNCPVLHNCSYGTIPDKPCGCCNECIKGPGEICGGVDERSGTCTNGTRCIVVLEYGLPWPTYYQAVGVCKRDVQPTPTPSLSSSPVSTYVTSSSLSSPSSSPPPSLPSSLSPSPSPQPTLPSCRPDCSLTFCADDKNRYCSAAGSEFQRVAEWGYCQQTTCKACRFHVSPNCPTCPDPQTKRCLRKYFLCVDQHYQQANNILTLNDTRAQNAIGKIICHIPDMEVMQPAHPNP